MSEHDSSPYNAGVGGIADRAMRSMSDPAVELMKRLAQETVDKYITPLAEQAITDDTVRAVQDAIPAGATITGATLFPSGRDVTEEVQRIITPTITDDAVREHFDCVTSCPGNGMGFDVCRKKYGTAFCDSDHKAIVEAALADRERLAARLAIWETNFLYAEIVDKLEELKTLKVSYERLLAEKAKRPRRFNAVNAENEELRKALHEATSLAKREQHRADEAKAKNKRLDDDETPQDWYFTFGSGQPHEGGYIKFFGTYGGARERMVYSFGQKWAGQYSSAEDAGVERFGLYEVDCVARI